MSNLSGINVGQRKFPSLPPLNVPRGSGRGRPCVKGSPYVGIDPFAKFLLLGATFLTLAMAVVTRGLAVFPLVVVGGPPALGLGFLIAAMGGVGWARLTALFFAGVCLLLIGVLLLPRG